MKINVTRKDIKFGEPACSWTCPIALAVKRRLKLEKGVNVGIQLDINGEKYKLPKKAKDFIKEFDAELFVKPFEFTLRKKS